MQNREVLVGMVADGSLYIQMYIRHSPTQEDQVKESQRQTMNFRLPVGVLTALRKRAKRDRVSMTTVVEAALRNFLGVPSYGHVQVRKVAP